ncbi:serine/threonine-protein kinase [Phytohabitans sp. ZYX-F-186]|uniref:non-specific serine/threonine protein kinase n=1 Tax=Phytohabitans maris TaxID=3071409 RepID=A0ABU0ZUS3_9ACTN|nr:serine/threonine-protein kinase [Phytohabitans sp. ZYX-F-186]MDQ7910720.1 serine/threonine-protein kinase [Phytohabitans sp. ZYX-F-186]
MEALRLLGGRYRLEDQIGTGGMSVVWRATDEVLRRPVAVKVLAGRLATDAGARLRIQAEARSAARLAHPHVCGVYDYGESTGADGRPEPFVVMELLRGPTLSQRIADGPLPPREAMRVCAEVAGGVAAAHDAGLVHRDIKPSNVILTTGGAKVVDFGIAAAAGPLEDLDQDDRMIGTPAYLAPERLTGDQVVPASDVYALGLLVHYVLVGKLPWAAETTTQMIRAHTYAEPDPLPAVAGVPPEVADLCGRCLAKEPADRPTAAEVADVLARAAGVVVRQAAAEPGEGTGDAGPAPDDRPTVEPAGVRRRRRTLAVAVGAATVVATVVVAALIAGSGRDSGGALAEQRSPDPEATGAAGSAVTVTTAPGGDPDGAPAGGGGPAAGQPPGGPGPAAGSGPGGPATSPGAPTAGPAPEATPTTPEPAPSIERSADPTLPPRSRVLVSPGGTVLAKCQRDGEVKLLEWDAAGGYRVTKVVAGPALTARIWFDGPTEVRMKIRCKHGEPTWVNSPD